MVFFCFVLFFKAVLKLYDPSYPSHNRSLLFFYLSLVTSSISPSSLTITHWSQLVIGWEVLGEGLWWMHFNHFTLRIQYCDELPGSMAWFEWGENWGLWQRYVFGGEFWCQLSTFFLEEALERWLQVTSTWFLITHVGVFCLLMWNRETAMSTWWSTLYFMSHFLVFFIFPLEINKPVLCK